MNFPLDLIIEKQDKGRVVEWVKIYIIIPEKKSTECEKNNGKIITKIIGGHGELKYGRDK